MKVSLEKYITLFIFLISAVYAWESFTYDLLPFEEFLPFKPNTFPIGLSVLSLLFCIIILSIPGKVEEKESNVNAKTGKQRIFDYRGMISLIGLMLVYTVTIRVLGFLISTSLFLIFGAIILGERKYIKLLLISLSSVVIIWYLVDVLLGIYLSPWPSFFLLGQN